MISCGKKMLYEGMQKYPFYREKPWEFRYVLMPVTGVVIRQSAIFNRQPLTTGPLPFINFPLILYHLTL
jgi:hypothetical protein